MTETMQIEVGSVVVLQDGYDQVGDAGRGPLKLGGVGTVVEIGGQASDFDNSNMCQYANDRECNDPDHTNYDGSDHDNQCFKDTDTTDCDKATKDSEFSSSGQHLSDTGLVVLFSVASEICQVTHTNVRTEGVSSLLFKVLLF